MFYPNRAVFSFLAPVPFSPVLGLPFRRSQHGYKFWFGMVEVWYGQVFTLQILSEPNPLFGTRAIFTRAVPEIFCSVNRGLVLFAIPDVKITGLKSYI